MAEGESSEGRITGSEGAKCQSAPSRSVVSMPLSNGGGGGDGCRKERGPYRPVVGALKCTAQPESLGFRRHPGRSLKLQRVQDPSLGVYR